jgi:hypothetical protein
LTEAEIQAYREMAEAYRKLQRAEREAENARREESPVALPLYPCPNRKGGRDER